MQQKLRQMNGLDHDPVPENVFSEDVNREALTAAKRRYASFINLDWAAVDKYQGNEFADVFHLIHESITPGEMNKFHKAIKQSSLFRKEWTGLIAKTPGLLKQDFDAFDPHTVASRRFWFLALERPELLSKITRIPSTVDAYCDN